ncbi:MAG: glycoside hydrolase family 5 protein [Acidimicrobiales bacterium]|nr:glycoside hydrolase family 5 protein [Acidimicrobiales bacterium]
MGMAGAAGSRVVAMVGTVVALFALALPSAGGSPVQPAGARAVVPADVIELRPLTTSPDLRIVDDLGRDVLLRGANVNSLAEYWQGVPSLATTVAMTDADWDLMASHGFSVVRLLVTWSRIQPTRGVIDETYLDQVEAHVEAAAARGIYTVIDMHQDAYSSFISSTPAQAAECPAGTTPAKGWDGAPEWATLTDGLSTCLTGSDRNSSPAVTRAWNNFYDDVEGIRGEFVEAWAAVAGRFAGRPEVAGYDLLNEPEASRPSAELTPIYEDLLADVALAIRAAEADADFDHLLIVEPALPAGDNANGLVIPDPARVGLGTTGIVASVHNYAESISVPGLDLGIEAMNDLIVQITGDLGVATWGGEYGFWDTQPTTLAKVRRYAVDEDAHALGGAWWQWRQACGDPHAVRWQDGVVVGPGTEQTHLNRLGCPGDVDLGPNGEFLEVLGRAYPRATPGRITKLTSAPDSGALVVQASAAASDVGEELVVWAPALDGVDQSITVEGLRDLEVHEVPGGRILTAEVVSGGAYQLCIGACPGLARPAEPDAPASQVPDRAPVAPEPAAPIAGSPSYAG